MARSPLAGAVGMTPAAGAQAPPPGQGMTPPSPDTGGDLMNGADEGGEEHQVVATICFDPQSGTFTLYHGDEPEEGGDGEEAEAAGTEAGAGEEAAGAGGAEAAAGGGGAEAAQGGAAGGAPAGEAGEEAGEAGGGGGEEVPSEQFDDVGQLMHAVLGLVRQAEESGTGGAQANFNAGFNEGPGGGGMPSGGGGAPGGGMGM